MTRKLYADVEFAILDGDDFFALGTVELRDHKLERCVVVSGKVCEVLSATLRIEANGLSRFGDCFLVADDLPSAFAALKRKDCPDASTGDAAAQRAQQGPRQPRSSGRGAGCVRSRRRARLGRMQKAAKLVIVLAKPSET